MSANAKANILLAVDPALGEPMPRMATAIDITRELVRDGGDHVIVLHVREFSVGRLVQMMREHGDAGGRQAVDEIVSRLRAVGITASGQIREADVGHVSRTILDAAADFDARLIVVSPPRHRVLVGGVAEQLMHHADVPIVIAARTKARVKDTVLATLPATA